jgi:DNA replication licensing factor MCM7
MIGSIPRTYNVFLKGTNVGSCSPGDLINLTGIFLNQRPEGFIARLRDNLLQNTYIYALKVKRVKESFE